MEETIPSGLYTNSAITLCRSDGGLSSLWVPLFTVGYALVGYAPPKGPRPVVNVDKATTIVFRRKMKDDASGWDAFNNAKEQYPGVTWFETGGTKLGAGGGAPTRYWVMTLTPDGTGAIELDTGKGLDSLDDVLLGAPVNSTPVASR